jgi:AbrB family looped-hinge helix DNA binding protein
MSFMVNVSPNGRISLPAAVRKRLGVASGGALVVEETDTGLVLRTLAQSVSHAQALAARYTSAKPEASVDAFLAQRLEDSGS